MSKQLITGYDKGANIVLLNTHYARGKKDPDTGKYSPDMLTVLYKDLDTGEKKIETITNPEYTYYMAKPDTRVHKGMLFIEEDKCVPITCKYKDITKSIFDEVKDKDDVTKMQYLDMNLWLPNDILLKADKMTMAHSLELRVPFLDKEVFNFSSKIPSKYLIKDNPLEIITSYICKRISLKRLSAITTPINTKTIFDMGLPTRFIMVFKILSNASSVRYSSFPHIFPYTSPY